MLALLLMGVVFYFIPRWRVYIDTKQWTKDNSDKYGNLWHKQRTVVTGLIIFGAAIFGHFFWLYKDIAALIEGVLLSTLLGGAYFSWDFNPRLNERRALTEPWITKWYVSRSKTTAQFDQLLCAVADSLAEPTDVVLRRVSERNLALTAAMYGAFLVVEIKALF
jgi:hypothetical protein